MLLKYLNKKGKKGAMIKTVGVSNLIDVVAKTGSSYLGGNLEYLADVGTDNIFLEIT